MTAVALIAIGVPVVGFAAPAQAHNYLVSSTPSAGQVLTAVPTSFSVTTNDLLLNLDKNSGFAIQVTDSAGTFYGDGCVDVAGATVSTPAVLGSPGNYTMTWQVVSTDGHQVSDRVEFSFEPPAGFVPSAGASRAPDCHGTAKINASEKGVATSTKSVVASGVLSTVLWVGGGVLIVGVAVIVTIVVAGRRKK